MNKLFEIAMANLNAIEKEAFVSMPGGQLPPPAVDPSMGPLPPGVMPPMDPAMGGMPMDPAMGGMPMDPAMGGMPSELSAAAGPAVPAAPVPPQGSVPGAAAEPSPDMLYDMISQIVRQVMEDMGVGNNGKAKKLKKPSTNERLDRIEQALGLSEGSAGGEVVPEPDLSEPEAAGMSSGSGEAVPPPPGLMPAMGPLDPNAGALIGGIGDITGSQSAMSGIPAAAPLVVSASKIHKLASRLRSRT